jgi:glycosyltransferase involved in cell wall biosynthesis
VSTGLVDSVLWSWDVVHLNWLSDATLSIEEIGKTQLPVVWTLHDMWPYCGAEHQTLSQRFVEGYHLRNRPALEKGPDINRRTWLRKKKAWKSLPTVVAPSHWSALNARKSALLGGAKIKEIPHPLDTEFWAPHNIESKNKDNPDRQRVIRLGLPAPQGSKEWGKGLHWVEDILEWVLEGTALSSTNFELWVFGGRAITLSDDRISVKQCGWLDDEGLRNFYREIDLLVFPSTIDTFGMVAAEAQSCGTPVVCFQDTGVESVVGHETTGYTATYGDLQDFAEGVLWCCESPERLIRVSEKSRERALELWDMKTIGRQYAALFRKEADRSLERLEDQ